MSERFDVAIIGAGIAGASMAAFLAPHARVVMLEGEDRPGYHATGRSAAFWEETYGGPQILPLTVGSGPYLRDHGFLSSRGALNIGREEDRGAVERYFREFTELGANIEMVGRDRIKAMVPGIRSEWVCGTWGGTCADIDVAAVHAHFLSVAKQGGVALRNRAGLIAAEREGDGWRLGLADGGEVKAGIIVNAAGAWASEVAALAGASAIAISPMRRTVAQLRTAPAAPADLPLVLDINDSFYFKPESGRVWLSPHDETPSPPCDAAPEEIDVAIAIDRMEKVVDWRIETVERKWAGLRSFSPDRTPVYGFDTQAEGFFWCAGQGGSGIQTSPAGGDLAASLLLGREARGPARGIDAAPYSPRRFG